MSAITSTNSVEISDKAVVYPLCFLKKGVIIVRNEGLDEEKVMEDCFEAGAVDFNFEDEVVEIFTDTTEVSKVRDYLTDKGYELESAEVEYIPSTYTRIDDEELRIKMGRLLEMLDDNDDVQNVWHNWDNEEE